MPEVPAIAQGEVQLWCARVDEAVVAAAVGLLDEEERARMERMRLGIARHEFVVGRAMLRVLAGAATACGPREGTIGVGEFDKPRVEGVEFSVAHSHGLVVLALCLDAAVGVDVEWVAREIEALEIAQSNFAPEEKKRIEQAAEGAERARAFFAVWTKKEAIVKAHGQGLTIGLESFEAPESDAEQAVDLVVKGEARRLYARGIDVGEGFAGALAAAVEGLAVRKMEPTGEALVKLLTA
jgi:4'-phosphopantetheinyl transferase